MDDPWQKLDDELDRWAALKRTARLWLRDDDAVEPTESLDCLLGLCRNADVSVLLAIVPAGAGPALARRLAGEDRALPGQHGYAHRNHAPEGEKWSELGRHRQLDDMLTELAEGRQRMLDLFDGRLRDVLVPPWNRIALELLPHLPEIGLTCVSAFGWQMPEIAALRSVNCHVDIINWKQTRRVHTPAKVVGDLVEALAIARTEGGALVGILTHHLVHDADAWSLLETLFARTQAHTAAQWVSFDDV